MGQRECASTAVRHGSALLCTALCTTCTAITGVGDLQENACAGGCMGEASADAWAPESSYDVPAADSPRDAAPTEAARSDASDACSADLATDPANCGACGHSCLGGACTASACQPFAIASNRSHPIAIADDAGELFVLEVGSATTSPAFGDGGLVHMLEDGSGLGSLAKGTDPGVGQPACLTLDPANVYFTNQAANTVIQVARASGVITPLASGEGGPLGIALDAALGQLYWANYSPSVILRRLDLATQATATLFVDTGGNGSNVLLEGANVYWQNANLNTVQVMPKAGCGDASACPVTVVANGNLQWGCQSFAVDGTSLYWSNGVDGIYAVPKRGGSGVVLSTGWGSGAVSIVLQAPWIYWTYENANGKVMRMMNDGSTAETLATGQAWPRGLAVTAGAIYWVNQGTETDTYKDSDLLHAHDAHDGAVMKLAL